MKKLLIILFLINNAGCVYDPPIKGKDIYIENQTNNFVYVTDTLPLSGSPKFYDTLMVNRKIHIGLRGDYIPQYGMWPYFLPDKPSKTSQKSATLNLYFVSGDNCNQNWQKIISDNLYSVLEINSQEIRSNELNYIFFTSDSIYLTHQYSIEKRMNY